VEAEVNRTQLFDDIVLKAMSEITDEHLHALKTLTKDEAQWRLHFTLGGRLRAVLHLWDASSTEALMAISDNANQGILIGFDADGASAALIGHIWDKYHPTGEVRAERSNR
jgi:hypothetical protein